MNHDMRDLMSLSQKMAERTISSSSQLSSSSSNTVASMAMAASHSW